MKKVIQFKTTLLPEYDRSYLWYGSVAIALIVLLAFFTLYEYSLTAIAAIASAIFAYYCFVYHPENPESKIIFTDKNITIGAKCIPLSKIKSYSCLRKKKGRPQILLIFSEFMIYSIPIPNMTTCEEVTSKLKKLVRKKRKAPIIHRLCHTFKI